MDIHLDYYPRFLLKKDYPEQNITCDTLTQERFIYLSLDARVVFFATYLLVYIFAFVGNIAAIIVTARRKHRCIQKTCIISMALSDFITATFICGVSFNNFLYTTILWRFGSFMCTYGPVFPIFGIVSSCIALVGIALDRYRNVVHAFKKRWNPSFLSCMIGITLVWIISAGVAFPMGTFYLQGRLYVQNPNGDEPPCQEAFLCVALPDTKRTRRIYLTVLICTVFVPLLCLFLWFYNRIAVLVWNHRKPVSSVFYKANTLASAGETSTQTTTQMHNSEDCSKPNSSDWVSKTNKTVKNTRSERKIRTFKVIIFLMLICVILRVPSWIYDAIKTNVLIEDSFMWIIKYVCSFLMILNCALNPLLYTFLHQTLQISTRVFKAIKDFTCEVCCCCISNKEFEEFENENPFIVGNYDKKSNNSTINDARNSAKVKFDEQPSTKSRSQEVNKNAESYRDLGKY